jgi:hypothetical protein
MLVMKEKNTHTHTRFQFQAGKFRSWYPSNMGWCKPMLVWYIGFRLCITTGIKTGGSKRAYQSGMSWSNSAQPFHLQVPSLEGTCRNTNNLAQALYQSQYQLYILNKTVLDPIQGLNQTGMKVANSSMGPGMKEGGKKSKEKSLIPGPGW